MVGKVTQMGLFTAVLAAAGLLLSNGPAAAQDLIALPSGLEVSVQEVIFEESPAVSRFRFVAPDLGGEGRGYEEVRGDFPWLCEEMILPALSEAQKAGDIVISLADREVVFGQITPEATQFFEVFSLQDGACVWEEF